MTELNLVQVDNPTLEKEYQYFKNVSPKASNKSSRQQYLKELEEIFKMSDRKHDGMIDKQEFRILIKGYFDMKGICATKENFDTYFDKLDINHDQRISFQDFVRFMDQVTENDIIPFLSEEMQNRNLFQDYKQSNTSNSQ
ncbi:troponin skeletal muscle-like [Stylonychia lemnae]|uniref:Troponin skeletal muscle-like n=1 Tax=Stylonychia lemnae TaxID=5949 RepID=A0A078AK36_STYLE|nr:troponin skeletal muscle-like [Stylonychia lemnae]|eukprot:CDW82261.1 troponin skeletal muscle-like [Stylonychia lemnae]